ncbi:hypothetical protein PF003_g20775 [Phytophthora fragariae]|nr:hypothetical protein PF003_g20775 [Phytophthora fragariae]
MVPAARVVHDSDSKGLIKQMLNDQNVRGWKE